MSSPNAVAMRLLPSLLIGAALTAPAPAQQDRARGETAVERAPAGEGAPSASTVTREQLDQRNVQTLSEAVAYTPESSVDISGFDPRGDAIDIRGFDVTYTATYRDGLRRTAANLAVPRVEPYGTESVTVLRGPAAGIYGFGAPGILSVTTKRPQFDPSGEVQLQLGNYDRVQGNFDLTGPVEGSDGTMAYRLTGLVRQSNTYLPGAPDDRVYLAPAFTWKPDADTTFTVLGEYMHLRLPSNPSYYFFPGYVVSRTYEGGPPYGVLRQDQSRVGYAFEHKLTPDLIVRQNLRYADTGVDFAAIRFYPGQDPARIATGRAEGYAFLSRESIRSLALDNQVEAHVDTGPVAHTLLAGLTYYHYDYARPTGDVDNLEFATLNGGRQLVPRPVVRALARQSEDQLGLYLQEQAKWDSLVLTLAGRQDWVSSRTRAFFEGIPTQSQDQNQAAFTYRVGLSYQLTPDFVPYASYNTFFTPQPGTGRQLPFPPATGDQIEAGVKVAVPDSNITGSVSGFSINQSSNTVRDLTTVFFQVPLGSVNARGFEMEMTANLAPGTSLTLAYRHLDFRFTRQTAIVNVLRNGRLVPETVSLDGNTPAGIPGDTFNAFGTYLFPTSSPLSGLTLGGGVRFTGASFADDQNTVRNPTVTLFDAVAAYDLAALDPKYKGFRAQLNAFNIFNRQYTNCQNLFCYRGAPATVIGTLVYRW